MVAAVIASSNLQMAAQKGSARLQIVYRAGSLLKPGPVAGKRQAKAFYITVRLEAILCCIRSSGEVGREYFWSVQNSR